MVTTRRRHPRKLSGLLLFLVILVIILTLASCSSTDMSPGRTGSGTPHESSDEPGTSPDVDAQEAFDTWWQDYKKPFNLDTSSYPGFLRGAWASRLDEARSYLLNAERLKSGGFDSILLGIDVVFDPETGAARSLGDDLFIFYLQAFKKAGFRVILVPNPMHPNLDMGKGYEWEGPDSSAGYHRGYELLNKMNPVVVGWAGIAEQYHADGFVPINEPYKLVRDCNDASRWLQEILVGIKEVYRGQIIALDTMLSLGQGRIIPYPYDYSGYDVILGGPPCGWKDIDEWGQMMEEYIREGNGYAQDYACQGFGLYEWGAYTSGVWYEPIPEDQILNQSQARLIIEAVIRQADGITVASFPRVSIGWSDFDTPAFRTLAAWYNSMGEEVEPLDERQWTYAELVKVEKELAGDEYGDIFQITEPSLSTFPEGRPSLPVPEEFDLTDFVATHEGEKVTLTQNTTNHLFNDCEVCITTDNIKVSESKFVNSRIIVSNATSVTFERVIFRELKQYEQTSLVISNSRDITVDKCQFVSNYIGAGIHSSSVNINKCRFEHNNGHNALVIGEGSSANVEGNYFYGSFPHAMLIMNRGGESDTMVNISRNYIDQTGEDAIDFEDYRNAAPSNVAHNIITNSGWSAVVIEYNSWQSNITVENNWIENTGIDWTLPTHDLQPERFQSGWGHGILVEDSTQVRIRNNRILSAAENGIEIRNSREVVLAGNGIDCSQAGIGVYRYNEYSLHRDFSPLSEENAGSSQVRADNNVIYLAQMDYDVDESCQFTLVE